LKTTDLALLLKYYSNSVCGVKQKSEALDMEGTRITRLGRIHKGLNVKKNTYVVAKAWSITI
jgi:hypothetical protein